MDNRETVLSIEIMTSGTRPEFKKSVASLTHLRERIACQLIVVDTGCCDEDMKRFIKENADTVVAFSWCDDFAAARNAGLDAATGKWFMFLDDDEWFENTNEIENFFTSDECDKYDCVDIFIRNYTDMSGKNWSSSRISRLQRIGSGIRFYGCVHWK